MNISRQTKTERYILSTLPVLYLSMRRDGAAFLSDDGHGFVCTVTGATRSYQGRAFDSVDDGGVIPHDTTLNPTEMSIIAWVNGVAWTRAHNYIVGKQAIGAGYMIEVLQAGKPYGLLSTDADAAQWVSNEVLPVGKWYNLTVTFSPLIPTGYINGVLDTGASNITGTGVYVTTTNNLNIGYSATFAGRQLEGTIGEILIYNRILSAVEVRELYRRTEWRYR